MFDLFILLGTVLLAYALGYSDGRLSEREDNEFEKLDKNIESLK